MRPFARLLRAEWAKFRTVRGWIVGLVAAVLVMLGFMLGPGMQGSCGRNGPDSACTQPTGPDGGQVSDSSTFVHRPLTGDGTLTVRLTAMTGLLPRPDTGGPGSMREGVAPWAKAGIIIRAGTQQGAPYAAVLATGAHGVRMQYDYTHDRPGGPGGVTTGSPRWLRLTRTGTTVTGWTSGDGEHWTAIGTAHLAGLPATVEAGMFATSPQYVEESRWSFGLPGASGGPTQATGTFDHITLDGTRPADPWSADVLGGPGNGSFHPDTDHSDLGPDSAAGQGTGGNVKQAPGPVNGARRTGDGFVVTGSGDIAPAVSGAGGLGTTIERTLVGTFAGLMIMVVIGALFVTAEYRRGLIRTTVGAWPRRGQILAAKATVLATVTFVTGLVAAVPVVALGVPVLRSRGVYVAPASLATEVRVVVGTAALLAVAAVLALAIGVLLRRSAAAVTAVVVLIVMPYLLAMSVLPTGAAQWLLRVTPAAAFAVQQTAIEYHQVDNLYSPPDGYFPLPPWAGFAVLCAWAAVALAGAAVLFRRRDV